MSGAHRHTAEIYGFQGGLRKGETYVRKMWLSSSFISLFCNGKQAFYKHLHTKPSMKRFMNSSALTKNHSIKTGNNNINNAINHTPSVTSHHHPPSRGESAPLRRKTAASLSSSNLHSVCISQKDFGSFSSADRPQTPHSPYRSCCTLHRQQIKRRATPDLPRTLQSRFKVSASGEPILNTWITWKRSAHYIEAGR